MAPAESKHKNLKSIGEELEGRDERRRVPRLSLASEQFRLAENGKIFSVDDLSIEGMGLSLIEREDLILFPPGRVVSGDLHIGDEKVHVDLHIKTIHGKTVGCRFQELSDLAKRSLEVFLDPNRLGKLLKSMPAHQEERVIWYHGPGTTDLIIWKGPDRISRRFVLYVYGSFVQWDREEGLISGRTLATDQESEVNGVVRLETRLLEEDPKPDQGKIEIAKKIILSSKLPEEIKFFCSERLRSD